MTVSKPDTGYWFSNGHVISKGEHDRIWKKYDAEWTALFEETWEMEARHRKERGELEKKKALHFSARPFTPWLGHIGDGVVPIFLERARQELPLHKDLLRRRYEERMKELS